MTTDPSYSPSVAMGSEAPSFGSSLPSFNQASAPAPTPSFSGPTIDEILKVAVEKGASDIHISAHTPAQARIDGDLTRIEGFPDVLTPVWIADALKGCMKGDQWERFSTGLEMDMSYTVKDVGRFRLNVMHQRNTVAAVFRIIPTIIKTLEELKVPPILAEITHKPRGLVLVTGPTGSGKALRLDTPLPTPTGWTTMGQVKVGDSLLDSKGRKTHVTGLSPINETPDLYRVKFSDGQEILADADHQWIVKGNAVTDLSYSFRNEPLVSVTLDGAWELVRKTPNNRFVSKEELRYALSFVDAPSFLLGSEEHFALDTLEKSLAIRTDQRRGLNGTSVFSTGELLARRQAGLDAIELVESPKYGRVWIESIDPVVKEDPAYGPVRCLSVDSPDSSYLCGDFVVTHNSTTLAAMIDAINSTRPDHIMTIEDPIEFVHQNKRSLINQREVGTDTKNFAEALKRVLRQDPDVILVGELRDPETISVALTAAETGHLVFGTLHTQSAAKTINRLIDSFPAHQQNQVRSQLADTLQAVIAQSLLKKIGGGRVAATEIMVRTNAIANMIREGQIPQMYSAIQTGSQFGMHTLDQDLQRLVGQGYVSREEAAPFLTDPAALDGLSATHHNSNDWNQY